MFLSAYSRILLVIDIGDGVLRSLCSKCPHPFTTPPSTNQTWCRGKKKWESETVCLDCHSFSKRSYSDPDFKTPEEYDKDRWQVRERAIRGAAFFALCHTMTMVKQLDGNDLGQMAAAPPNTGAGGQQHWHGHQGLRALRFWWCPAQLVKKFGTPATLESLQDALSCSFGSCIQAMVVLEAMHGRRCLDQGCDAPRHAKRILDVRPTRHSS